MDGRAQNRRHGMVLAGLVVLAALLLAALGEGSLSPRPGEETRTSWAAEPSPGACRGEAEDSEPSVPRYVRQIQAWILGEGGNGGRDPEVPAGDGFSAGSDRRPGPPCR